MGVIFSLQRSPKSDQHPASDEGILLKGEGSRAILLIHGLTGSPAELAFVARSFHREGYTVFVPRIAGHGASIFELKKKKWEAFHTSMREAFQKLRSLCDEDASIFVGGLSMGALLALLLAQENPSQVAGVISFSATLFFDGWNVPWTNRLLPIAFHTPLKHFFYFKEESPYGLKSESARRHVDACYRDAKLDDDSDASRNGYAFFPVALFCELQRLVTYLTPRLSGINAPLLLFQAVEDDMTSPRNSEFIRDNVNSAVCELILLEDSYHVITADRERYLVAEKAIDFCNRMTMQKTSATSLLTSCPS